ncbi:unnamed protein product [Rhizoctonia solani]|uniref:Laminin domain protein n=1 Tax=Rhizoctonia solani TaxID=456999 RepID=A0A8H3DT21_9AGAM|nr:unnamed protein product [Rhizoctonia solani]
MADNPGWYPPGQLCYPPETPLYLKNIHDLKPIVGVPSDNEVIAIHAVIHAASRVSGVPGMHDPKFFTQLADHLFNVQMARYRSKYSLITFPSDATYTPPALPTHISVNLEPVSGAPSDDEITKVHEAIQTYQELRRIPSLFDARVNMELSQHLFDIQMARHMRAAGEIQPRPIIQGTAESATPAQATELPQNSPDELSTCANNAGKGANVVEAYRISQPAPGIDVCELMERSNQLAERFNQLLERSNELAERNRLAPQLDERFSQILDRLALLMEQPRKPAEYSDSFSERFNQLAEELNQPVHSASELAERSNELADKANQLIERFIKSSERGDQLLEQTKSSWDRIGDVLGNINRVLVGVQHAIVRNHKGNTVNATDCLVNEKGQTLVEMCMNVRSTLKRFSETHSDKPQYHVGVIVDGVARSCYIPDAWLGDFLQFYGIAEGLCISPTVATVTSGKESQARTRLHDYFSSRLG